MTKQPVDKKQQIVEAALKLLKHTHAVKKVSIEDIAREAHVSPTTIYNQFGTRETLVREAAKVVMKKLLEMSAAYIRSDLPFPTKLVAITSGKIDIAKQVDTELLVKLGSQDPSMAPFIEETYRSEINPLWHEFIADGKKQGYIDPSVDEEAALVYFDIIRTGMAAKPELMRDWEKHMPLLENLTRLMLYGLLKKDIDLFNKETRKTWQSHRSKSKT